jgi:hypothetical protein
MKAKKARRMSIVMGVDQHRAQITAGWIDVDSGEISRAQVRPADRAGVRRFLERFAGQELEVALEATTGWRFFVEELRAVGAVVHLAESAETAARRGNKRRAKTDLIDARHHRELLLAGRLPESWIPPDHILGLRARVRVRRTVRHTERRRRGGDPPRRSRNPRSPPRSRPWLRLRRADRRWRRHGGRRRTGTLGRPRPRAG